MGMPLPKAVFSRNRWGPEKRVATASGWGAGSGSFWRRYSGGPGEGGTERAAGGGFRRGLSSSLLPFLSFPFPSLPEDLRGHGARARRSARPAGWLLRAHGGGQALGADLGSSVRADGEQRDVGGHAAAGTADATVTPHPPPPRPARLPAPVPRGPACLPARQC